MLTISSIKNVQNTINNNKLNFTAGVRTNHGANVVNNTADYKHEGNFLTDFLGTIKQSPFFYQTFFERQASIEKGLEVEQKKLDAIA